MSVELVGPGRYMTDANEILVTKAEKLKVEERFIIKQKKKGNRDTLKKECSRMRNVLARNLTPVTGLRYSVLITVDGDLLVLCRV